MTKPRISQKISHFLYLLLRVVPAVALFIVMTQLVAGIGSVLASANLIASKTDALHSDVDGDGQADVGDTLRYTVVVQNSGDMDALNAAFSDTIDANTTLVGGSIKTTPIARNDGPYSTVGNVQLTVNAASGVLTNDNDPDGSGPLTIQSFDATSANGGSVVLNADGSFTFNPAPGFSGNDTFNYTVADGDTNSDSASVSITVGQVVWFINNAVGAPGDGRYTSPFNSVANFNALAADDPGDYIFVYQGSGAYSGAFTLLNTQQLIGHGVGLSISPNLAIAAAARPTIANVTLATSNTVRGLNVNASSGTGLGGASVGTLTINNVAVSNTAGVGVSLANGALAVTLDSVSASNAANGIVLSTTTGSFSVTGTGGTCTDANTAGCSGGTIHTMTGADNSTTTPGGTGIVLNSAANVSLTRMYIHDTSNYGLRGTSVNGLTIANSVISGVNGSNVAAPFNDGSISIDELAGTSSISNSYISGGYHRNVRIDNTTGALNLTMSSNSIHNTSDAAGDDGVLIEIGGGSATLSVTNNTFFDHGGDHFNLSLLNSPIVNLTFTGNAGSPGSPVHPIGLSQNFYFFGASFNGTFDYNISNNTINGTRQGSAIHVNKGSGSGVFDGFIEDNIIGINGVADSGASESSGINIGTRGSGSHTVLIDGNTIQGYDDMGINIDGGEGGVVTLNATVTNNLIRQPTPGLNSLHGIHLNWGVLNTGNNSFACVDIRQNDASDGGNAAASGYDFRLRQRNVTTVRLPGYAGVNTDNAAVQTFITGQNTGVDTALASNNVGGGGGGFVGGANCTLPIAALAMPAVAQQAPQAQTAIALPLPQLSLAALRDRAAQAIGELAAAFSVQPALASGETINLSLGTLNPGQQVTITFDATVDSSASTQVCNQGTLTANSIASVLTDDPAVAGAADPTCTPIPEADLRIVKSDSADPVASGANFSYTVTVYNDGPDTALNVEVNDTLPLTATFVSTSGCAEDPAGVPTCTLGTIASGGSDSFTINVTAPQVSTDTTITNQASVTSTTPDPDGSNNSVSEDTLVSVPIDLAVSKTESADPVIAGSGAGSNLTYTITVQNTGTTDATRVEVTETLNLPAGVSVSLVSPSQGSVTGSYPNPLVWTVGNLAAGQSGTLTVDLIVGPSTQPGTNVISDTAAITAADQTLINTGDDSDSESTSVSAEADLSISITDDIDPVIVGNNVIYTLSVFNQGPSDAAIVNVASFPSAQLLFLSTTGCAEDPNGLVCTLGTIPAGSSDSFTFATTATVLGQANLQAIVTSFTSDTLPGNNTATEYTDIVPLNTPPVAVNNSYNVVEDTLLSVPAPGVLDNDTDADLDPLTAVKDSDPTNGVLTFNSDGSFDYDPNPNYCGPDSFTYHANDGQADSSLATVSLDVQCVDDGPSVSVDIGSQTKQYSDFIDPVTITASDPDSASLSISDDAFSALSVGGAGCSPSGSGTSCSWQLSGQILVAASLRTVNFTISDGTTAVPASTQITVTAEDATVAFDSGNPIGVQVSSPGGSSGPFTLKLYVQEVSESGAGVAPGDINLAGVSVTLAPIGPGSSISGSCSPAAAVPPYDYTSILTVNCDFDGVPVNTYAVQGTVNLNGYYAGYAEEVLAVFDPSLGFTTGGGWFYWPGTTDRTTFGYTMKYGPKGGKPTGSLLLIRHLADGTIYRLKSNALTSLALKDVGTFGWASFTGKGTYLEPGWTDPVGNYSFTVYVEDHNQPGTGVDRIWIQVMDKNGIIEPDLSMASPAQANTITLAGGNISVPHGKGKK